ncbi:MAG: DNA double-strand break repair nuclease NurA [Chloroflexi bacterium]|nr:DNA double-strand break repair nuclease NurA [Chloroflexota bacterium]
MPVNYQDLYTRIKAIGAGTRERRKKKEDAQTQARELFAYFNSKLNELRSRADTARSVDTNIRCAYPLDEDIASSYPLPASPKEATVIAADGSQIVPDRHAALQYYVINVGVIAMQVGSGSAPEVTAHTELRMLDEFEDTFFSDSQVALQRDVAERKKLLEAAQKYTGTVIALTEGQLELWGAVDNDNSRDFEKSLQDYIDALRDMEKQRVIASGYVDKPGANWVVRLLEVAMIPQDELPNLKKYHPFLGVTDRWLFSRILGKHERSAIFKLQAKSAEKYTGSISIHFFYINVGDEKKPKIARVDVPLWVVNNKEAVNNLHGVLIEQAKIMGNEPFPYLLHRAHEIAVVTHKDKDEIDQMLAIEIRNNGGEVGEKSGKQSAKDLRGRTRM